MKTPLGTLSLVAIQDRIYNWIYSVTQGALEPEQIIWRNQSEPLPPRPCVAMKFTYGPSPIARDGNVLSGGAGTDTVGMQMEATLSVQIFGSTKVKSGVAGQLAIDLNSSLLKRGVKDALKLDPGGVSIQGLGKVNNLTALEESEYEERYGFEVALGMVQNLTDEIGVIKTVNLNGDVSENVINKEIVLP